MRKLFKKLGTGMTGKIHTQEAMATGRTWADALTASGSGSWKSCQDCLHPAGGRVNSLYIRGGVRAFLGG